MKRKPPSAPLPDVGRWQPRDASQSLSSALEKECKNAEDRILQGLNHERRLSVDNFESGLPFENLVKRELRRLLPQRYSVGSGLLLDRAGKTAGKCDVVLFNEFWLSPVKSPVSDDGGQPYFPIEGVYGVGEIKQTISDATLDKAMEKLVTCHRLYRPRAFADRLVENREGNDCIHGLTNPLFSFILAGSVEKSSSFESIVDRFYKICSNLKRLEMVRILCVLGEGVVFWGFRDPTKVGEIRPALFNREDLFNPIFPLLFPKEYRNPLCGLVEHAQQALFHTVLAPENVALAYSNSGNRVRIPNNAELALQPDEEWLSLLDVPCQKGHK